MYYAIPAVVEGKSVLISKVDFRDQQLAMELLNNLLDIAYAQGKIDATDEAMNRVAL